VVRDEVLSGLDAEPLREHRSECLDLHLSEAGERCDAFPEVGAIRRLGPEAGRVAVIFLLDQPRQLVGAVRHRAREPMDCRLLAERLDHDGRVGGRDLARVERAEPLLQLERA
jgi:hypothetical protein